MPRFIGKVGYGLPAEMVDGVWSDSITEREYTGEVLSPSALNQESDKVNDDLRLNQRFSIVADAFATENFSDIKYILWMGTAWKVTSVSPERPRLILTVGGVYDGPRPSEDPPDSPDIP